MFDQTALVSQALLRAGGTLAAFTRNHLKRGALALFALMLSAAGAQAQTAATAGASTAGTTATNARVYVADYNAARVRVFDPSPNPGPNPNPTPSTPYVGYIPVGDKPFGMAQSPDGRRLYVACSGSNSVYVIDTRYNNVMFPPVQVGAYPIHIAVSPDGNRIFVTNFDGNSVSVVNVSGWTSPYVERTIPVAYRPMSIALRPGGRYLYVGQYENQNVKVFDTTAADFTEVGNIFTGQAGGTQPIAITFTPDGNRAFIANEGGGEDGGTVSFVDTHDPLHNEVKHTVVLPDHHLPRGDIQLSSNGRQLYVPGAGMARLDVIDTLTGAVLQPETYIGVGPHGIAMSPNGSRLYVGIEGNLLSTVDTGLVATQGQNPVLAETYVTPEVAGGTRFLSVVYVNVPTCPY